MTYPTPFLRLVATGSLYTVETFSWSLSLIPTFNNPPLDQPEEVPAAVATAVSAFHTASGLISNKAQLRSLKLNLIGTDGRYVSQTDTVEYDYPTPLSGQSTSSPLPQAALAITLRTDVRRGLASTGRFYIPTPGFTLNADGRFTPTDAATAATRAATMLNAINAAVPGFSVGVVSNVREGAARPVTRVTCGRVVDTIRSRRASIDEDHAEATLAVTNTGDGGAA